MSNHADSDLPVDAIEKWEDDFEQLAEAGIAISPDVRRLLDHYREVTDR